MIPDDWTFSASQVKAYKSCPKQYWFRYRTDKDGTKADKGYLAMGSAVHESIENVLNADPTLRDEDDLQYRFRNELSELMDTKYTVPEKMRSDAIDCVDLAATYIASRTDATIEELEKSVEYPITRDDFEQDMVAKMDVVTENEIWDWKTGKVRAEDEKIQGVIYIAAYASIHGEPPEALRFIYLKEDDGKVRKYDATDEDWENMIEWAKALKNSFEQDEWPAQPGDPCYFCEYEFFCDEAPTGVGNMDWADY